MTRRSNTTRLLAAVADPAPDATAELRARLHDEHERAVEALAAEDVASTTTGALAQASARTEEWTFERDDFAALEPSLRRIYRGGRKRLRAASAQPSAENLHDCRKRVKNLWHVAQILRPAHPKRMKRLSRRALKLGRRVYKRSPKRFVAEVRRGWRRRVQVA